MTVVSRWALKVKLEIEIYIPGNLPCSYSARDKNVGNLPEYEWESRSEESLLSPGKTSRCTARTGTGTSTQWAA